MCSCPVSFMPEISNTCMIHKLAVFFYQKILWQSITFLHVAQCCKIGDANSLCAHGCDLDPDLGLGLRSWVCSRPCYLIWTCPGVSVVPGQDKPCPVGFYSTLLISGAEGL